VGLGAAGACWWRRGGASGCIGPLPVEMLWWRGGATYCLVQVCATGTVLSRAKAFTDDLVGGNGGGGLVAPFFLLRAPL
jgi:hypothetical protein